MCQAVNISSLEEVIKYFLKKASEKAEAAQAQVAVRTPPLTAARKGVSKGAERRCLNDLVRRRHNQSGREIARPAAAGQHDLLLHTA
eukprot:72984-Chlamydomonas_euryale.AAC.4